MSNVVSDYGWGTAGVPQSCGYLVPAVLRVLQTHSTNRVCDIGSGNGALVGELCKRGYQAVGVEFDKEGVRIAEALVPNARFFNLGVQDDPQAVVRETGLFDAVVSTEVIEHLFSPHLLPAFAKGLLKADGMLVVSTPYHGYLKNLALSILGKWDKHHTALWHGGHIKFWSRKTLTALLEENGFDVVGFKGVGRVPFLWKSMILSAQVRSSHG